MAYVSTIPQATDKLSVSQGDLLNNFIAIDTFVNVNHYGFGTADEGKHLYIQMPITGSPPGTAADEVALYTDTGLTSGNPELWVRRESNGAQIAFTEAVKTSAGWTMLPSGVLLQWGTGTIDASGSGTINFPRTFPVGCLNVQLTSKVPASPAQQRFIQVVSFTTAHFVAKSYTGAGVLSASDCYFFAVGY